MTTQNSITQELIDFVQLQEGCKLFAYRDTGGTWTLGTGTTFINGNPVVKGQRCSKAQADSWLKNDLQKSANAVNSAIKVAISLKCWNACVDLAYNIGCHAFEDSTLVKLINSGRMNEASQQFMVWDEVDNKPSLGLIQRRASERALFMSGLTSR